MHKFPQNVFLLLFLLTATVVKADLARPRNHFNQKIKITNLEDFPEYEFYFMRSNYRWDKKRGHSEQEQVFMESNKAYDTGEDGASVRIYARLKAKKRRKKYYHKTQEFLGGKKSFSDEDIESCAVYKIEGLQNRVIQVSRMEEPEGNSQPKQGEYRGELSGNMTWYFWLLPSLCLISLAGFFLYRARSKEG